MDLCAMESTDGDLGDHGAQLETNQRSNYGDLGTLQGTLSVREITKSSSTFSATNISSNMI